MPELAAQQDTASTGETPFEAESACRFLEAIVAAALGAQLADLRARNRGRQPIAAARQMMMYLAHVKLGLSLTRVGELFGRDRTTVAHACARVEDSRDDPNRDRVVACLEAALDAWQQVFGAGSAAR